MSTRQFEASQPELMDRPDAAPAELEAALRSLRGLNRYFGSYALVMRFMRRWIHRGDHLRIADLATGSADIPRLIAEHARAVGAQIEIVAVDLHPQTIASARKLSSNYPEIRCEQADVLTFGRPGEFDIVICSLALHHFSDADAVLALTHASELSTRYVLVADLRRGPLAKLGVHLLTALVFRDSMTRDDGRTSAARAFSFPELCGLARRAGWKDFGAGRFRFARQAVWLEKPTIR